MIGFYPLFILKGYFISCPWNVESTGRNRDLFWWE